MIAIDFETTTTTRFTRKAWELISKAAWERVGAYWHERILPKHFTTEAASQYGYEPRGRKYMIQKAAAKGHQRPLVYKGDLERAVTRLRDVSSVRARGSDTGAVNVRLSGPRYLHQRPQPKQPNLALELSSVSDRDADELARVIDEFVTAELGGDDSPRNPEA